MSTQSKLKVKELTVEEFKNLISESIRDALDELLEDLEALKSKRYLDSIKEARADYRAGRIKRLEELLDV